MLLLTGVLAAQGAPEPQDAEAQDWPELEDAGVRPGVAIEINRWWPNGPWCSANFLFEGADGTLYLGTAAHCVDRYGEGTWVGVRGVGGIGRVAFNAWDHGGESSPDFALIELNDRGRAEVHPAMLHYGGPTALADSGSMFTGEQVMGYGTARQRGAGHEDNPRVGRVVENAAANPVGVPVALGSVDLVALHMEDPALRGDSGMGVVDGEGRAFCVLVAALANPLWAVLPQSDTPNVDYCWPLDSALEHAAYSDERFEGLEVATWELLEAPFLPV